MELPSSAIIPAADEALMTPAAPPVEPPALPPVTPSAPTVAPIAQVTPEGVNTLASKSSGALPQPVGSAPTAAKPLPPRVVSSPDLGARRRPQSSTDLLPELPLPPKASSPRDVAPEPPASSSDDVNLSPELQEQLFSALRSAFDASLAPLLQKQAQLEARLLWLYDDGKKRDAELAQAQAEAEALRARPPMRPPQPSLSVDITPTDVLPPVAPKSIVAAKVVQTSFGPVIEASPAKNQIDVDLANVGPIDIPDFGGRSAGRLLLVLLLAGVVAAIAAMILSYT